MTRKWSRRSLAFALIAGAALATFAGVLRLGLFSDDFQWLSGGQQFEANHLLNIVQRGHFFRPLVELYLPGAIAVCGHSDACFHGLTLALHIVTSLLVAALVASLSRTFPVGVLAGVLFAVQPGPVEAITWVSAVCEVLATALFVLTTLLFRRAMETSSRTWLTVSVVTFVACLVTHESSVTLLPILVCSVLLLPSGGEADSRASARSIWTWAPFALALVSYSVLAYIVNARNYVVTEGQYALGLHIVPNIARALVALSVSGRGVTGFALIVAVYLWAATLAPPRIRFFALWTLITLTPFALFRGGLSSRYLYLPAVGFAAMTAELLWCLRTPLFRWPRAGIVLWWFVTIFITARSAAFASRNVHIWDAGDVPYRRYVGLVRQLYPAPPRGAHLEVPAPPDDMPVRYVEPLLQWEYRDSTLTAVVR